jgi:hypothetical protein
MELSDSISISGRDTLTLLLLPLSQSYSRTTAVLVDELDAGRFESSSDGVQS